MAFDLVIFDCDGVLVDSEIISISAYADVLARYGVTIAEQDISTRFLGHSYRASNAEIEAEFGVTLPPDFIDVLYAEILRRYATELRAIPHIQSAVASVSGPVCVASSAMPVKIKSALDHIGLYERFAPHIFSAHQVARGKPAPDLFLLACGTMKTAPARCLVIEDSVAGITAARAAEMTAFGFCGGSHCRDGHGEKLRTAGADVVFSDMRELAGLVNARPGPKSPV